MLTLTKSTPEFWVFKNNFVNLKFCFSWESQRIFYCICLCLSISVYYTIMKFSEANSFASVSLCLSLCRFHSQKDKVQSLEKNNSDRIYNTRITVSTFKHKSTEYSWLPKVQIHQKCILLFSPSLKCIVFRLYFLFRFCTFAFL